MGEMIYRNPSLKSDRGMCALKEFVYSRSFAGDADLDRALNQAAVDGTFDALMLAPPSDPAARAEFLCYQASLETSPRQRMARCREILRAHPDCALAEYLLLDGGGAGEEAVIPRLRALLAAEERHLAPHWLTPAEGELWDVMEARTYVRIRRKLALALLAAGDPEGAEHLQKLLELSPEDDLALRDDLLVWHLEQNDAMAVLRLLMRYPADEGLTFAWGGAIAMAQAGYPQEALSGCRDAYAEHPVFAAVCRDAERLKAMFHECAGTPPPEEFELGEMSEVRYAFCQLGSIALRVPGLPKLMAEALEGAPAGSGEKQARNARCACGSGKKHKHCCGRPM